MTWNGKSFFAPESLLTKDGRRVMWAWLVDLPIDPSGVQSLPRVSYRCRMTEYSGSNR